MALCLDQKPAGPAVERLTQTLAIPPPENPLFTSLSSGTVLCRKGCFYVPPGVGWIDE